MKTAMKKLLSLMLVAVLLVSVVPFASAVQLDKNYVAYKYMDNGTEVTTYRGTTALSGEYTDEDLANGAKNFLPDGYDFLAIDANEPDVFGDTITYTVRVQKHIEEMVALVIELVVKGGDTIQYNIGSVKKDDASETMSKADALIKLAGQGSEYEITSTEAYQTVTSSKIVYSFTAEKKTSNVTLTVNLSTGGSVTISVEPGTKITRADVQKAIEKALGTSDFDFTLSPKAPFTLNESKTITANVTKNNNGGSTSSKNVTLTVNLKGDASGSVSMTVAAGTQVTKAEIRDAIVNKLGRSNFTFTLNPTAPVTVNQNMEVTASVANNSNSGNNGNKNVTLTMVVSGDYSGTAKLSVARNSTVSVATMKDAIKSQLGITSNFTLDRDSAAVVKDDTTLYIVATKAATTDNKFPYKVYLHVYLNNNIGEPDRNLNITNSLAVDGTVSMSEVKNLIPTYYKAKDSNGIGYDGLYLATGNWVKDYVTDSSKYDKLDDVDVRRGDEYVHINVMITNAVAKNASTADPTNPKTGDAIFMTITIMGLSAVALTGLYFYDKKRKAL